MDKRLKYGLIIVFLILLLWFLYYIQIVLVYILISLVIAMLGRPLVWKLEKVKIAGRQIFPSSLAALIVLLTFIFLILGFVGLIIPVIIEEADTISQISSANGAGQNEPLVKLGSFLQENGLIPGDVNSQEYLIGKLKGFINLGEISTAFSSVVGSLGNVLMGLFSVVFISFYFLQDSKLITATIYRFTPQNSREKTAQMFKKIKDSLSSYFVGLLVEMVIVGVLIWLGMLLLGVKHAAVIGFFAGVMNIIPYLGPWIGGLFAVSIAFITKLENGINAEMGTLILLQLLVVGIVQMIDNFFLQPRIYSKSVNALPLEIFLVILIGGTLGGVMGMIVAVPAYTFIRIVALYFFEEFSFAKFITASMRGKDSDESTKS